MSKPMSVHQGMSQSLFCESEKRTNPCHDNMMWECVSILTQCFLCKQVFLDEGCSTLSWSHRG